MKKWVTLLSCALLCMTMGLFIVGCGEKAPKITLVDFHAAVTDEVNWGEEYALRRIVEDEDGKSYTLNVSVKTKAGADVTVVSNKFQAIDLGGYVITYTAKITDKDARTSVVTLTVIPDEEVAIVLPEVTTAYKAKDEITIPEAKVNNVYDGEVGKATVKSLSYTEIADNNVIVLEETAKTYTPAYAGKLTIVYSYADAEDKTLVIEVNVNRGENNAIASGKDAVLDFSLKKMESKLEWNDEGKYMVYAPKTAGEEVKNCNIDFTSDTRPHINEIKEQYDYLHIKVNPRRDEGKGNPNNRARFTLFNDGVLSDMLSGKGGADPKGLPFNEWSDVYIPVESVNTEKGMVITAQFNYAHNFYDQMSEMWLDGFDFVKNAELKATFEQEPAFENKADVTLTIGTDREDATIADCNLTVKNSAGEVVDGAIKDGVWSKKLAVGAYSYRIELTDTKYVLMDGIYGVDYIDGTFTVQNSVEIVLPDMSDTYKALDTVTIPTAQAIHYQDGNKGDASVKEMKYTEADGTVIQLEKTITSYQAENSGKLAITFSFEGAVDKTLEIAVNPNRDGRVLATGKDALNDVTFAHGNANLTYDEEKGYYVFQPNADKTETFWEDVKVTADVKNHVDAIKNDYDYLRIRVYCKQDNNMDHPEWLARVRLFQGKCNTYLYGSDKDAWENLARFSFNEWCDIYLPVSLVDFASSADQLLSGQFFREDSGADYCNMSQMWLDGFEFVKAADLNDANLIVTPATSEQVTTLTVTTGNTDSDLAGYTLRVYKGKFELEGGVLEGNVWSKKLGSGTYTYKIKTTDSGDVFMKDGKVTEFITGTFTVE